MHYISKSLKTQCNSILPLLL